MAKNVPGAAFVSKGVKYVLDYGPKGNLRPYTVGPVKTAVKTRNLYIIGAVILFVSATAIGVWVYKKYRTTKTA